MAVSVEDLSVGQASQQLTQLFPLLMFPVYKAGCMMLPMYINVSVCVCVWGGGGGDEVTLNDIPKDYNNHVNNNFIAEGS